MTQPKPDDNDHDGYELDPPPEVKMPPRPGPIQTPTPVGKASPKLPRRPAGPDPSHSEYERKNGDESPIGFPNVSYRVQFAIGAGLWLMVLGSFALDRQFHFFAFGSEIIPVAVATGLARFARRQFDWRGIMPGMVLAMVLSCLILFSICAVSAIGIR